MSEILFRRLSLEPGSPGHMSTTLMIEVLGLSLQVVDAKYLDSASIDLKKNK